MDPVSILPVLLLSAIAVACAGFLGDHIVMPVKPGRFSSIDGLRGYLALFVFMHHASIWYFYLHTGNWGLETTHLYAHLGKGSVGVFFMITGFLFMSKLIEGRKNGVDWLRLYVSRFMRLTPLYLVALAIFLIVVFSLTGWALRTSTSQLIRQLLYWLTFTIPGAPDVNGLKDSWMIVAGVTWSLRYEWIFYLCLPLLALSIGNMPPTVYLLLAVCALAAGIKFAQPMLTYPFLGGIAAAFLSTIPLFRAFARSTSASFLIVLCVTASVCFFPGPEALVPLTLLALAFSLISCGNSFFGLLTHRFSRALGEMAYGIYLLHGLLLFITFRAIVGLDVARSFTPLQHWLLVACLVPVLVGCCFATLRLIEQPAMNKVQMITDGVRRVGFWRKTYTSSLGSRRNET